MINFNRVKFCKCGCRQMIIQNKHTGKYADYFRGHSWRGKKRSGEQRKYLSESRIGSKNPNFGNRGERNSWFGKKVSEQTKIKISIATKGPNNPRFGAILSEDTKNKIRIKATGRLFSQETKNKMSRARSKEGNPNWRNGISFEPYSKDFDHKLKVFIKSSDKWNCRNPFCKKISKTLVIHHIDYDKLNCNISNLITLCASCNSRANFKREFWQKLYSNITEVRGYEPQEEDFVHEPLKSTFSRAF